MTAHRLPAGVWRREAVVELKRSWRLPQFLLPTVLMPGAFYGLFTLALARDPTPTSIAAGIAGYGVFAAIGPALFGFGVGVAIEREQGLIELKRVSPMPTSAYVTAKLVAALAATALALILIYVLGAAGGASLTPSQWSLLAIVHLGSTIPFGLIGIGIGMRMGSKGAVAIANVLFMLSAVIGGLWIPAQHLPDWMRAAGEATPGYHLGQLAHAAVGGEPLGIPLVHGGIVTAMTLIAAYWAWTGWRKSPA